MLGKPHILSLFLNSLINSIKLEHSCKLLYVIVLHTEKDSSNFSYIDLFVEFDALPNSQHFFSYVWIGLPGLYQY